MSEERKKEIKTIADRFNDEIQELAIKTEKEIELMINDSASAFETIYKRKPAVLNQMMFYDDLIIRLIHNLLVIRDVKALDFSKKINEKN